MHICANPPTKLDVHGELVRMLTECVRQLHARQDPETLPWANLHQYLSKRTANRDWMLELIMTITNGNHAFFRKDFKPITVRHTINAVPVDNEDGFFDGLPLSDANARRNNYAALRP